MPLIDDRGRLFGKVNLIDALVGLVVLGLIPLAYGAFLLFRVPKPKIDSLAPAQVQEHQATSVQVTGADLRPFLLAKVGIIETELFVQSPTRAELKIPATLAPGTYDVQLLDQGQLLLTKPAALTVVSASPVAPPTARLEVQAVGAFVGLDKDAAGTIAASSSFRQAATAPPMAEVLALRAPEPGTFRVKISPDVFATGVLPDLKVPAILRLHCAVVNDECRVGDMAAAPNAIITLPWTKPAQLKFLVNGVFPPGMRAAFPAVASVRVRFVAGPNILNIIKPGDVDLSGVVSDTDRAVLTEVGSERQPVTSIVNSETLLRITLNFQEPALAFNGTLRVPVVFTPAGWTYKDRPLKVGGSFIFETASGAMSGWVVDMNVAEKARVSQ